MKEVLLTMFGAVIGFFVSRLTSHFDRKVDGRNDFRDCILDLHAKLDSSELDEEGFFEESLPILRQRVWKVLHFVSVKRQECLRQAMKDYEAHHKSEFAGGHTRFVAHADTGKSHKERLHEMLNKFEA
jgi:hypothetical protein